MAPLLYEGVVPGSVELQGCESPCFRKCMLFLGLAGFRAGESILQGHAAALSHGTSPDANS